MNINFNTSIPNGGALLSTAKTDKAGNAEPVSIGFKDTKEVGDKLLNFYPDLNISAIDKEDAEDLAQLSKLAGIPTINVAKPIYTRIGNEVAVADKAISDFTTTNNARDSLAVFEALV